MTAGMKTILKISSVIQKGHAWPFLALNADDEKSSAIAMSLVWHA
jgi:hypothetical protein